MTPSKTDHIHQTNPNLSWQGGHPVSNLFGDVYYHEQNGLAETNHVFLDGCDVRTIFSSTSKPVIAELGFGTGLNALAAADVWLENANNTGYLHIVSVEGFPLSHTELTQALGNWRSHLSLIDELLALYPKPRPSPGYHRLWLRNHGVCITLLVGPVLDMLCELIATVDAWFLDGFAPAKNPDMWHPDVLAQVARLSKPGTRLSTFTAAGEVRRNLAALGFDVTRAPGFGKKKHMIRAIMDAPAASLGHLDPRPAWMRFQVMKTKDEIHVNGAGIAGASVAYALKMRRQKTKVFETAPHIANGASGNPAGLVKMKLDVEAHPGSQFQQSAFQYARQLYQNAKGAGEWSGCLDLAITDKDKARLQKLQMADHISEADFQLASDQGSRDTPYAHLPTSGWINPKAIISFLLEGVEVSLNAQSPDPHIICTGPEAWMDERISNALSMSPRLGQVTQVTTQTQQPFKQPVSYGHYAIPMTTTELLLGATFDPTDQLTPTAASNVADTRNISALQSLFPDVAVSGIVDHRASPRATTPDRLPYVGPLPDSDWIKDAYSTIHDGKYAPSLEDIRTIPNLWVVLGLGSRGLTTAPLCGELVVSQMLGDPWPVPLSQALRVTPVRDLIRRMKNK